MGDDVKLIDRTLEPEDYDKNVMELLAQLSTAGVVTREQFAHRCGEYAALNNVYHVAVIEDVTRKRVVAVATLLISLKLMHSCGKCGHIEDVVVDSTYRGQRLGYRVVERLMQYAQQQGCYKVILNCSDKNIPFYEKLGFEKKENGLAKYFA